MKKPTSVDDYLAGVPEPARTTLTRLRAIIRAAAPAAATEKISYGMPAFYHRGGLVAYAAFKDHCSLFPMDGELITELTADLKAYALSKGTIRFPSERPLPAALVKKIVKARVARNEAKQLPPKGTAQPGTGATQKKPAKGNAAQSTAARSSRVPASEVKSPVRK